MIVVTQSAVSSFAPGVQSAIVKDTATVRGPTRHLHYLLTLQRLYQLRGVTVTAGRK